MMLTKCGLKSSGALKIGSAFFLLAGFLPLPFWRAMRAFSSGVSSLSDFLDLLFSSDLDFAFLSTFFDEAEPLVFAFLSSFFAILNFLCDYVVDFVKKRSDFVS